MPEAALQATPGPDPFSIPNDRWMQMLEPYIGHRPLKDIVIPGSHDAGSYDISRSSWMTPDAPLWMQGIGYLGPVASVIAPWAKAQGSDMTYQLMGGIRYFDLRVAPGTRGLMCVHSMEGASISSVLDQVADFIESRPKEVVILHFQHFYNMRSSHHDTLISSLRSKFGNKLARYPGDVGTVTPADLYAAGSQVIVVYSNDSGGDSARSGQYVLWPDSAINSPDGGGFQDVGALQSQLDNFLGSRDAKRLLVLQCVLTPDAAMVAKGAIPFTSNPSSLKDMASHVTPQMVAWIADRDQRPLNIVMVDWFDDQQAMMPVTAKSPLVSVVHQCKRINILQAAAGFRPQPVGPHTS